jgi:hypothetical protein
MGLAEQHCVEKSSASKRPWSRSMAADDDPIKLREVAIGRG